MAATPLTAPPAQANAAAPARPWEAPGPNDAVAVPRTPWREKLLPDLVVRFGLIKAILLPTPWATLQALATGLGGGPLLNDSLVTVGRTLESFLNAAVVGVPLGALLGSNESTLVNMIEGLAPIDAGEILFDGKSLADTKIGYVFQNLREALLPWRRTIDNIRYPLEPEAMKKGDIETRIGELEQSFSVSST